MKSEELIIFSESMSDECDVRIRDKSQIGWWIRRALKLLSGKFDRYMPDFDSFLRPCCLKIWRWFYVIPPFDIGCKNLSWIQQVLCITHECEHAMDVRTFMLTTKRRYGNWVKNYLFDDTFRAFGEGMPNTAEGEVYYWLTGNYPNPMCNFDSYLIRDDEAKKLFRRGCDFRRREVVSQGERWTPTTVAALNAIRILRDMGIKQGQIK